MSIARPLHFQKGCLPYSAVRVECLDKDQNPIPRAVASGFLRRENGTVYLYTAWHVVTGFDPHHIDVGFQLPVRRYLRVATQDVQSRQPGVQVIGGSQSIIVPLYVDTAASVGPLVPMWQQNDQHIPHKLLNNIGLFVPFWGDVVRIALPDSLRISDLQLINSQKIMAGNEPLVGDKCCVVGFPYGFSAVVGVDQSTPIVLTRFIASTHIEGARKFEFFLDGYGAPGMSGGPVFLECDGNLYLFGIYTGDIFPDYDQFGREKTTALGTVADIRFILAGHVSMSAHPSEPLSASGFPAIM